MWRTMERNGHEDFTGSGTVRIKTLRLVCVGCILIRWVEMPSTPPFIG
jgi:hypothetical protein